MRAATLAALIASLAGGAATSQAPEFAQQYRQRLEGALQEIRHVVADFDADAARNNMQRGEALAQYDGSAGTFLRDRGRSMRRAIERFEHLDRQSERLHELPPALRPVLVMVDPDGGVFEGTLRDFEPAVPLTAHGAIWTALGLLGGFAIARLVAFPLRRRGGRRGRGQTSGGMQDAAGRFGRRQ